MTKSNTILSEACLKKDGITVTWQDGYQAYFHNIWLRHSPGFPGSECPAGPHGRFPTDTSEAKPVEAQITPQKNLNLKWSNNQVSEHDAFWLRENEYGKSSSLQLRKAVKTWSADSVLQQVKHEYQGLADNDNVRLALFEHLLVHGGVIVKNAPAGTITTVANYLGHVPHNLYADETDQPAVGNVRIDPSVSVATNMCHFLGPHTDTCWRQTLSGLVILHCLQAHPDGGRSIVVDGYTVAERLRERNRPAFDLLARVPLNFGSKVDDRDDWRVLGRVISVDANGEIEGIRYNGNSIGRLNLPNDLIEPTYKALEAFEAILYDQNLWWQPLLQPGDMLIVDNHRVLHGRQAFDPGLGVRHLQTCSVDRDDFHNRYRRLAKKLNKPDWDLRLTAGVI
jgi:gamma-butyrobetaine dioxygenase|tara:strand:- start:8754 stop:9938 length:1185 start_codon:yes stop_codon:yes gene_type:complete